MKLKELQTIDAEELASQPLPPPSFIVDGLIPYGLCVLAGPSKCGKSWLMLWLCMHVSRTSHLGEKNTEMRCAVSLSGRYLRSHPAKDVPAERGIGA